MMYSEFIEYLGSEEVSFSEYTEIIEPVYMWHPMFETGGIEAKKNCAMLYKMGGLGVFKDLRTASDWVAEVSKEMVEAKKDLDKAKARYESLVIRRNEAVAKYVSHSGK